MNEPLTSDLPQSDGCPRCGRLAGLHEGFCRAGLSRPSRTYELLFDDQRLAVGSLFWLFAPIAFVLGFAVSSLFFLQIPGVGTSMFLSALVFSVSVGVGSFCFCLSCPAAPLLEFAAIVVLLIAGSVITVTADAPIYFLWPTESTPSAWLEFAMRAVGALVATFIGVGRADATN